jgi:hypothetical protein
LNWPVAKWREGADYKGSLMYLGACLESHGKLTPDQQETCLTLADVIASARKAAAEGMAAHLPPAPRCPL